MCVHRVLCVILCVCVLHTGLAGGIPLVLGLCVSWILLAHRSPLHKLRSLLYLFFFEIHSSQFNGPLRRKASPLYRSVTHIPSHGSAGRRVGWQTGVPP